MRSLSLGLWDLGLQSLQGGGSGSSRFRVQGSGFGTVLLVSVPENAAGRSNCNDGIYAPSNGRNSNKHNPLASVVLNIETMRHIMKPMTLAGSI